MYSSFSRSCSKLEQLSENSFLGYDANRESKSNREFETMIEDVLVLDVAWLLFCEGISSFHKMIVNLLSFLPYGDATGNN